MDNRENTQIKITPAFARLHAHICGDGCMYAYKGHRLKSELKKHPRNNLIKMTYNIEYTNNCKDLLKETIKDFKDEFNKKATQFKTKNQIRIRGKWIYDLFKSLGAGKSKEWFISKEITSSSKEVKINWLRAFFDDEAHVSIIKKRIILNIVNKKGLIQIQNLLKDLEIESSLKGPYRYKKYKSYHLSLYGDAIEKYTKIINFNEPNKQKTLMELTNLI